MKSEWLPYDHSLDEYSRGKIIGLMRIFLYIIPAIAISLAAVDFIFGYISIGLITLIVPTFCWISMGYLNRGHVNMSMIIITSIMMVTTTIICFFAGGIHEVGIIIFPVIVFFSSLVMNARGVFVTTSLTVLCLALIVIEEQLDIFSSDVSVVHWVDMVVALAVLITHTLMTFNFANITKRNLSTIKDELENQRRYKEKIAENLEEKTELLRLVHHRVKNNLLLINSLIELESYENPAIKDEFKEISDSIHTIARAHDPLYHSKDYKQVSIKPYLEKLVATFVQSYTVKSLDIFIEDCFVFHEKALLLGILLQKLLSSIKSLESSELTMKLVKNSKVYMLEITSKNGYVEIEEDNSLLGSLGNKINGDLQLGKKKITLSFPVS